MKIPYGRSNFAAMRREGFFYVDKTHFLPLLESAESGYAYLMFLRPRRMGKSLLLSMLEQYYDLARASEFDEIFGGLWIHEHPTPERSRYLVLPLDFSQVASDGGSGELRQSLLEMTRNAVYGLLFAYRDRFKELAWLFERVDGYHTSEGLLGALMTAVRASGNKLYVLIDEYDVFANNLLSAGHQSLYEALVEHTGLIRSFYRTLKHGTQTGAIARLFVTGVSPILLDDMASGFNIVTHISQHPRFNALAGFTRTDVERAVNEFLAAHPQLAADPRLGDRDALLAVLEAYYDGYRFTPDAVEHVFNSDMVLYFLRELENKEKYPVEMLDQNARTDYARLQRLAMLTGASGGAFRSLLEQVLADGSVTSRLTEQFGVRTLSSELQFVSLLYYLGMVTISPGSADTGALRLEIPNRVIRELQWENLALLLKDEIHYDLDTNDLEAALRTMSVDGQIEPFLDLFHTRIVKALGLKDLRQLSEKALKLMLLTFISLSRVFYPLSEKEFAQGYCDLFLGVSTAAPAARFAWMLEIKYLPNDAGSAEIEAALAQAERQLDRYLSDTRLIPLLTQGRELKAGSLVFVGAKAFRFRPRDPAAPDRAG